LAIPTKSSPKISPDGKLLSWLAPRAGVMNVWVAPIDKLDSARPVTEDKKRGIRSYSWAYTGRHILYIQDKDGDSQVAALVVVQEDAAFAELLPEDLVSGPNFLLSVSYS
jgi:Tol biopolymer transport system component